MFLAIIFSESGSNDSGLVLGLYDSMEKAFMRLRNSFDNNPDLEIENPNDESGSNIGFRGKKGRFDPVGMAVKMELNKDVRWDV